MTTKEAIEHLKIKLQSDPEYRQGWVDNIAVCFQDAHSNFMKDKVYYLPTKDDVHIISNKAAENFIHILCL